MKTRIFLLTAITLYGGNVLANGTYTKSGGYSGLRGGCSSYRLEKLKRTMEEVSLVECYKDGNRTCQILTSYIYNLTTTSCSATATAKGESTGYPFIKTFTAQAGWSSLPPGGCSDSQIDTAKQGASGKALSDCFAKYGNCESKAAAVVNEEEGPFGSCRIEAVAHAIANQ